MNSQNILLEGVTQAFSTIPTILWVVVAVALVLTFFSKVLKKLLLPNFEAKPLLNKSEIRLYKVLQQVTPKGFHIFAQASYGEFLHCASNRKFWTVNAKRADFVICDTKFNVVAAVEYPVRNPTYGFVRQMRVALRCLIAPMPRIFPTIRRSTK